MGPAMIVADEIIVENDLYLLDGPEPSPAALDVEVFLKQRAVRAVFHFLRADSDEVARCSNMMSPGVRCPAGGNLVCAFRELGERSPRPRNARQGLGVFVTEWRIAMVRCPDRGAKPQGKETAPN